MKNAALYTSGIIFWVVAVVQILRYKLDIAIMVGTKHHVPTEVSLYASVIFCALGLWMFIAALTKNR